MTKDILKQLICKHCGKVQKLVAELIFPDQLERTLFVKVLNPISETILDISRARNSYIRIMEKSHMFENYKVSLPPLEISKDILKVLSDVTHANKIVAEFMNEIKTKKNASPKRKR